MKLNRHVSYKPLLRNILKGKGNESQSNSVFS